MIHVDDETRRALAGRVVLIRGEFEERTWQAFRPRRNS
jgi:hypothetical protein